MHSNKQIPKRIKVLVLAIIYNPEYLLSDDRLAKIEQFKAELDFLTLEQLEEVVDNIGNIVELCSCEQLILEEHSQLYLKELVMSTAEYLDEAEYRWCYSPDMETGEYQYSPNSVPCKIFDFFCTVGDYYQIPPPDYFSTILDYPVPDQYESPETNLIMDSLEANLA